MGVMIYDSLTWICWKIFGREIPLPTSPPFQMVILSGLIGYNLPWIFQP